MADYYFANPADCLSAALPGVFKSRRAIRYRWTSETPSNLPSSVTPLVRPGETLSRSTIQSIRRSRRGLFPELVRQSVILEEYRLASETVPKQAASYEVANREEWRRFFSERKFMPEPFDGAKSRSELRADGWSDYFIRVAAERGLLARASGAYQDRILDFIAPRNDVGALKLNPEQQAVVAAVTDHLDGGFQPFLLHGVTGSGKTLVYCHLAREALALGRTVLALTPEISLSGATLAYFRGFFGAEVTILHSAMTERERLESWRGIRQGKYRIVVGPRSAVFAPLENIGLIIVDEEHDGSYKQDDPSPRFHGRDAAIMRAKISNVPVLLGSASPSMESYQSTRTGKYRLLTLTQRPGLATLPAVRVVDMRREQIKGDLQHFSYHLKKEVDNRLQKDEQVILYLNRRGYSPQLKCAECGHLPKCPHCQVSLTYHKVGRKLSCHYCGFLRFDYTSCENCGGSRFLYPGAGTQKVEEQIPRLFKGASAVRFDSDTASGRKNAHRILNDFALRRHNLLLGTQMVTKGLDLPCVSLVGVLSADHGLDLPDFRASEKTFARLLQVSGRSGRSHRKGEVLIQTFYPDSEVISDAACQDYVAFFEREIQSRQSGTFPPFCRLVNFTFSGTDEKRVERAAQLFSSNLVSKVKRAGLSVQPLGPAPCPLYFLRKQYRRHLLVKTGHMVRFVRMLSAWEDEEARFGLPSTVRTVVDVDPDDMM